MENDGLWFITYGKPLGVHGVPQNYPESGSKKATYGFWSFFELMNFEYKGNIFERKSPFPIFQH